MTNDAALEFVEGGLIIGADPRQFRIDKFLKQQRFGGLAVDRRDFIIDGGADAVEFLRASHAGLESKR